MTTVVAVFFLSMCSTGPEPTHRLTVTAIPSEGGQVNPREGEYDDGDIITITATPNQQWIFERWSGDVSSTDNPVEIKMNGDKNITVYFEPDGSTQSEEFSVDMSVTDGIHINDKLSLTAGDESGILESFDSNDLESPPIAPSGAFFTGFIHDGMNLYKDTRPTGNDIEWELRIHRDQGSSMQIDWSISSSSLDGSLKLVDNPNTPSIDIDMKTNSSYTVVDQGIQSLFIVYSGPEPSKILTDINDRNFKKELKQGFEGQDRNLNSSGKLKPDTENLPENR